MTHRCPRVAISILSAALTAGAVAGCGGGGGRKQVLPSDCVAFQGAGVPAPSTVVAQQGSGSQCEVVQIELLMTDVPDVQTVDFTVTFDPAVASYEGVSLAGSVLSSGGQNVNILQNETMGKVVIDLTRFGSGVDFNGSGTLARLIFSPVAGAAPSSTLVTFSSTRIFGSETPPQEKVGIQWAGGELQVSEN